MTTEHVLPCHVHDGTATRSPSPHSDAAARGTGRAPLFSGRPRSSSGPARPPPSHASPDGAGRGRRFARGVPSPARRALLSGATVARAAPATIAARRATVSPRLRRGGERLSSSDLSEKLAFARACEKMNFWQGTTAPSKTVDSACDGTQLAKSASETGMLQK